MDHYPNAKTSIIAGLTLFGVALWQIFALISKVSLSGTFPQNTSGLAADLCYILLGLGILSLTTSARAVTLLCAGATAALALSNVMCSNWPASFNCTEWFGLSFPISLSLTILAAALALARSSNMRLACHIFAIMSLAFAVVALIGYTYGFDLMATVGFPSEFNLKNGVLTAIAGVGVISATASGGLFTVLAEGTLGSKMVRMMLPAVLIIPFFGLLSGPGQHEPMDTLVLLGLVIVGMPILILIVGRVLSGIEHDRNRAQAHIEAMNQVLHGQVQELEAAGKQLEEALQIREQMIANVSHELRTPLTSILGITDILLNQSLNQKDRDLLETIKQSGTTLLDTVSDMLCFSNIEQNRVNLLTKDVGLEEFMRHCVESIRWMARSKKLELSLTIAGDAPANIRTDRTLMEHLVRSLLNNAIKFTDDGFVRVHVSSVIRKNDLDWYEISISDSGPGITKSRLARIFEPFAQGDSSFAREHGGLGLGLALARRIAEVLGGTLEVDSITHRGTTVTVALPAHADEGATEQVRTHPHEDRPSKILIVEDNTVNAKILQMQLRMLGHDSDMASNGLQALRAVSTGCYGLLLMDVQMPIMDGLEATRQIRSSAAEWASIPIIAVTAHAADADRKRCLEAGMDDYITKPVDKNLLKSALARWLPQSQPPTKDSTSPAGFDTDFAPPPDEHSSPPREREDGNGIDQTPR